MKLFLCRHSLHSVVSPDVVVDVLEFLFGERLAKALDLFDLDLVPVTQSWFGLHVHDMLTACQLHVNFSNPDVGFSKSGFESRFAEAARIQIESRSQILRRIRNP